MTWLQRAQENDEKYARARENPQNPQKPPVDTLLPVLAVPNDDVETPFVAISHRYVIWSGALEQREFSACIACGRPPELHGPNALDDAEIVDDPDAVPDQTEPLPEGGFLLDLTNDPTEVQPLAPTLGNRGEGGDIGAGHAPVEGDDAASAAIS